MPKQTHSCACNSARPRPRARPRHHRAHDADGVCSARCLFGSVRFGWLGRSNLFFVKTKVSRLLLRDATYVADEEHLRFFGGRSLPVMLACPSRTLEVMPYALAARTEDAGLCVCDLQVGAEGGTPAPRDSFRLWCDVY